MESKCQRQVTLGATPQLAQSERKPQHLWQMICRVLAALSDCKNCMAGGYLLPKAASCGTQMSLGRVCTKLHTAMGQSSTQTSPWHPGYQCSPLNSSCSPSFSAWGPCWVALCHVKQLPQPHPGCVGSTMSLPSYLPSHTGHMGTGMSSTSPH